ncbi:hypothetical protein H696_02947 [Fonticula alba]|uniref:Uncharacterized protein n=1 Tax=Fonticula alba TaxID=691883 RepID=A0A058Z8G9_FONAL|nr:hypothetical protein H696_02947 [Fonticula alba]KCV70589.1 hypothetical protein H696_02947 [Fonticula alba]|eukprot:XP_009495105.1 hypothetical protein H696_02947 [Fonticula alba]
MSWILINPFQLLNGSAGSGGGASAVSSPAAAVTMGITRKTYPIELPIEYLSPELTITDIYFLSLSVYFLCTMVMYIVRRHHEPVRNRGLFHATGLSLAAVGYCVAMSLSLRPVSCVFSFIVVNSMPALYVMPTARRVLYILAQYWWYKASHRAFMHSTSASDSDACLDDSSSVIYLGEMSSAGLADGPAGLPLADLGSLVSSPSMAADVCSSDLKASHRAFMHSTSASDSDACLDDSSSVIYLGEMSSAGLADGPAGLPLADLGSLVSSPSMAADSSFCPTPNSPWSVDFRPLGTSSSASSAESAEAAGLPCGPQGPGLTGPGRSPSQLSLEKEKAAAAGQATDSMAAGRPSAPAMGPGMAPRAAGEFPPHEAPEDALFSATNDLPRAERLWARFQLRFAIFIRQAHQMPGHLQILIYFAMALLCVGCAFAYVYMDQIGRAHANDLPRAERLWARFQLRFAIFIRQAHQMPGHLQILIYFAMALLCVGCAFAYVYTDHLSGGQALDIHLVKDGLCKANVVPVSTTFSMLFTSVTVPSVLFSLKARDVYRHRFELGVRARDLAPVLAGGRVPGFRAGAQKKSVCPAPACHPAMGRALAGGQPWPVCLLRCGWPAC